jgi:hypothetical protein
MDRLEKFVQQLTLLLEGWLPRQLRDIKLSENSRYLLESQTRCDATSPSCQPSTRRGEWSEVIRQCTGYECHATTSAGQLVPRIAAQPQTFDRGMCRSTPPILGTSSALPWCDLFTSLLDFEVESFG